MTAIDQSRAAPDIALCPCATPRTTIVVVSGAIAPEDVPGLCARARALLEGTAPGDAVVWDVGALATPDAAAVDALARLQLLARHLGRRGRLRGASPDLIGLLELSGLADAVPVD